MIWVRLGMGCVILYWILGTAWTVAAFRGVPGAYDNASNFMQWAAIGYLFLRQIRGKK